MEILTDSRDVKQYIKKMRSRDSELNSKWGTIYTPVEMIALDGKKKIQAADVAGILRIIQSIPSPKAEPFKIWLAETFTTDISREEHPQGFSENIKVAKRGGNVAKVARQALETENRKVCYYIKKCNRIKWSYIAFE